VSAHIGTRIGWSVENTSNGAYSRWAPDRRRRRGAAHGSGRPEQRLLRQGVANRPHTAAFRELGTDEASAGLALCLRMQDHGASGLAHSAHRQCGAQFAPLSGVSRPGLPASLEVMECCLTHHAREPQEQSIVIGLWIIEAFASGA
jgi:hypothetical protein